MDADDQGHRYGNFPNYYSFHPPQNRLQVLEETNILSYIRRGLRESPVRESESSQASAGNDDTTKTAGAYTETATTSRVSVGDSFESIAKKPRIEDKHLAKKTDCIYYCDLGCNEGDLTIAMATSLTQKSKLCNKKDESSGDVPKSNKLMPSDDVVPIKCLGLDIDPILIERASSKLSGSTPRVSCEGSGEPKSVEDTTSFNCNINATFKVCNLCSESEHNNACKSFQSEVLSKEDGSTNTKGTENEHNDNKAKPQPLFDLTTIFSTTMWIHVHSGDDGLREFLESACSWTKKFLLIEPQPSGCYRKANIRLRKMGRPELNDVTSSRLKMRPEIEKEIQRVITSCGFRMVYLNEMNSDAQSPNLSKQEGAVTSWNRALHLYERVYEK